jgi:hypothetical protein
MDIIMTAHMKACKIIVEVVGPENVRYHPSS